MKAAYDSVWQHPFAFWALGLAFTGLLARSLPWLAGFFVVFGVEILADALQASPFSPVPTLGAWLGTPVAISFVVLGDLRFLLLVARYGRLGRSPWALAAALSFVAPVVTAVARSVAPGSFGASNATYLVHELTFAGLSAFLLVGPLRQQGQLERDVWQWLRKLALFELAQYGLWIASDLLILRGVEAAWGLRIVPNLLYYGAFLPFALATAPRRLLRDVG